MKALGIGDRGLVIGAVAIALAVLAPASFAGQPGNQTNRPNPTNPTNPTNPRNVTSVGDVSAPPIECWWKTDRNAVRVGETFLLTLTCAVLDTERVKVVVDESSLDPAALHLTPFEVVGGQRFRDIPNTPRRFFQYQYTVRALGEEFFGKEVTLPRLQVSYRVQNSLQGGTALQGRETQYSLVPVPIRVLSLVPPGTSDIRDTPAETFGDVETRLFRSNLLMILAGVMLACAALMALMLVARSALKRHATTAARHRSVPPVAVLGAALGELASVRHASQNEGWSSDLAGRALAALRLAGAVALSKPIAQSEADRSTPPGEGQVPARPGLRAIRGKKLLLSAAVTPDAAVRDESAGSDLWRRLSQTISTFTAARYSRSAAVDGVALDAALADGQDAVRRLRLSQLLRAGRRRAEKPVAEVRQTWAR